MLEIHNLIRGLSPYPTAFTHLDGKVLKVFKSEVVLRQAQDDSALAQNDKAYLTDNKTYLSFKCANGYLDILELQLEGKKRMKVDEFLRGHKF